LKDVAGYLLAVLRETLPEVDKAEVWTSRALMFVVAMASAFTIQWLSEARQATIYRWALILWLVWLFLVYAPYRIWLRNTKTIADFEEARRPRLRIVFGATGETDTRPYLQSLVFLREGTVGPPVRVLDRRYRVGIQNMSTAVIPNVSVRLESCQPSGKFGLPETRLLVQDSDPPVGERDLPPSKADEPTLWFDVVNEVADESVIPDHFRFCYAIPSLCQPVPAGNYEIVLRADGGGTSARQRFRVRKMHPNGGPIERITLEKV
jgi:hypothetical protein